MLKPSLSIALTMFALLSSCKPSTTESLRSAKDVNYSAVPTQDVENEKSFAEWTGRSDLKVGWNFETLP